MSQSMLERIAIAIYDTAPLLNGLEPIPWTDLNELSPFKIQVRVEATAALEAMKELPEELIDYGHLYASTSSQTVKEVWEGIINKVLEK